MCIRDSNRTRSFVTIGVLAGLVNGLVLAVLLPLMGVVGAAIALGVASIVQTICFGFRVSQLYGCGLRGLLPWTALVKVALCAAGAAIFAFGITAAWRASILGDAVGAILYSVLFAVLVLGARVEEARAALQRLKPLLPTFRRR